MPAKPALGIVIGSMFATREKIQCKNLAAQRSSVQKPAHSRRLWKERT
jgi:hypothetical protein